MCEKLFKHFVCETLRYTLTFMACQLRALFWSRSVLCKTFRTILVISKFMETTYLLLVPEHFSSLKIKSKILVLYRDKNVENLQHIFFFISRRHFFSLSNDEQCKTFWTPLILWSFKNIVRIRLKLLRSLKIVFEDKKIYWKLWLDFSVKLIYCHKKCTFAQRIACGCCDSCQCSATSRDYIVDLKWEAYSHLPYSLDLAALFLDLKKSLGEDIFQWMLSYRKWCRTFFEKQNTEWYCVGFEKLLYS